VTVDHLLKLLGRTAPKALKTFEWKAKKEDTKITFLKGKKCEKLPTSLLESYRKAGLIEPAPKKEEE